MTGNDVIIVAQAATGEGADAVQQGVLVPDSGAEAEHTVATTEAEGGEHSVGFPPFKPETFASQILWLVICFAALYVIVSRIAVPQIGSILENRRVRIEGDLKEAERLRQETEKAAAAYEEALAEARRNAHAIAEETRSSIRTDLDNKRASVEADLGKQVAAAEQSLEKSKAAALANVDEIAADTAAALAAQLSVKVTAKEARDAVAAVAKG
jgi:F-type H+-transporting ATPase subunit b